MVDEVILVDTDAICAAIKDVFEDTRCRSWNRPGALAIAGAKAYAASHKLKDKTLVAVASGANTNFDRLRFAAERAEIGEQREAVLAVTLPERNPAPTRNSSPLSASAASPIQLPTTASEAHVFVGMQSAIGRIDQAVEQLQKHGCDLGPHRR